MKYSLFSLIKEYNNNKDIIDNYLSNNTIERYTDCDCSKTDISEECETDCDTASKIMGLYINVFIIILIVSIIIWIWALIITIKRWDNIPDWARVVCVIGLLPILPGGPVITLVVGYVAHSKK